MTTNPTFSQDPYDLLVIGGGINGAAIAHLASREGFKVALIEKSDFASGTSSKSTKLLHGGLRYLENFEFDLVRESLKERYIQLKNSPHLANPLAFVIPVYKTDARPLWMMRLGVTVYDMLSGRYLIEPHQSLSVKKTIEMIPGLKREGLLGGVLYYDAQMDDARMCLENVLSAQLFGADVANYVEMKAFIKENGKSIGVKARDVSNNRHFDIAAKRIVCTVGPWANKIFAEDFPSAEDKIRTTKGIHIVYRKKISNQAVLLQIKKDSRVFFIIPWGDHSLMGTTDTDYTGDPDDVSVQQEDVDYLLNEARRVFPGVSFNSGDIVTTFAGLRPLVKKGGHPSKVSRKHVFERSYSGVDYVLGGKYTTYRKIAEEYFSRVLKKKIQNHLRIDFPLYGSGETEERTVDLARSYQLEENMINYLKSKYGVRYLDVLQLIDEKPQLKETICTCSPVIAAQVEYACTMEMAKTIDDIVWRRLGLGYCACENKQCRSFIRQHLGQEQS